MALVVHKMLDDLGPALVHEWVLALPALIGVLFGLTGLPYSVNRATGSLADITGAIKKRG